MQETKVSEGTLPSEMRNIGEYHTYFAFANRPGYSGVALFSKQKPIRVEFGMGRDRFDQEGRLIVAEYPDFILLPTYFPNGGASPERLQFKLDFYEEYLGLLQKLSDKPIIICGDVNTAHKEIDLARPKQNEKHTGFLPEERAWIDRLVASGFHDTFRMFCEEPGQYTWWDMKTRARERNVGWRIDYFFVSQNLKDRVKNSEIHPDVMGSDHCPISLEIEIMA